MHVQRRVNVGMSHQLRDHLAGHLSLLKTPYLLPALMFSLPWIRFRPMISVLVSLLLTIRSALRSRAALHLEVTRRTLSGRDHELQPTACRPNAGDVTSSAAICSTRPFLDWCGLPKD